MIKEVDEDKFTLSNFSKAMFQDGLRAGIYH